jgi:predicted RNA-binding protein with RPS1 domain
VVDSFIPASQLATYPIKNFGDLFKVGDKLKSEVIEFDKNNKKIVLSVIEYLKDKDQKEVDTYIQRFKLPKKFNLKDIQEKTKSFESEQIDFRIEDLIDEQLPEGIAPPVVINPTEDSSIKPIPPAVEETAPESK